MAVRTREELLAQINTLVGENHDDSVISLIEDVTDTLVDYEGRVQGDGVDWKQRYEDNDKAWRNKYVSRFNEPIDNNQPTNNNQKTPKKLTFESLFEEKEK